MRLGLTNAAKFYNFNPRIQAYREESNRFGAHAVFSTPTHVAEVLNGRVMKLMSIIDSSSAREPDAMKSWYQCAGELAEDEATREVQAILGRIGDTNTVNAVMSGHHEFQAISVNAATPDGQRVRVAPFPTVRLFDSNNVLRVRAEFRTGPTGIVGLTDWFNNR